MKYVKRIALIVLVLFTALLFTGCGKSEGEKIVTDFCDDLLDLDFDGMEENLQYTTDLSEYTKILDNDKYEKVIDAYKMSLKKAKFKVVNTDIEENSGMVTVQFTHENLAPVLSAVAGDVLADGLMMALGGRTDEEDYYKLIANSFKEKYKEFKPGKVTTEAVFHIEKENGKWSITNIPSEILNVLSGNAFDVFSSMGL